MASPTVHWALVPRRYGTDAGHRSVAEGQRAKMRIDCSRTAFVHRLGYASVLDRVGSRASLLKVGFPKVTTIVWHYYAQIPSK